MEIEIKKVCVASDFSPTAELAIHYGAAFAKLHGAELHLVHVLRDVSEAVRHPDFTASGEQIRDYFNQMRQDALEADPDVEVPSNVNLKTREYLASLEASVNEGFASIETPPWWTEITVIRSMRYGHPVEQICHYAKVHAIDMLILGTQGKTGVKHFLLGSVAERVVRHAPCPVLTVRGHERDFVT